MLESSPEVSVVIPVVGAAEYLRCQLDALARQRNAPDFEVLLADNGVTIDLGTLARNHGAGLRIRIINATDRVGAAHARNVAAAHALGRVLLFCDDDDLVSSTWVAAMARQVQTQRAVNCPMVYFFSDSLPDLNADLTFFDSYDDSQFRLAGRGGLIVAGNVVFFGGNLAIARSDYMSLGGMDESYRHGSEDRDMALRFVERGGEILTINDAFLAVREHSATRAQLYRAWYRGPDNILFLYRHSLRQGGSEIGGLAWRQSLDQLWRTTNIVGGHQRLVHLAQVLSEFRGKIRLRLLRRVPPTELHDYSPYQVEG